MENDNKIDIAISLMSSASSFSEATKRAFEKVESLMSIHPEDENLRDLIDESFIAFLEHIRNEAKCGSTLYLKAASLIDDRINELKT